MAGLATLNQSDATWWQNLRRRSSRSSRFSDSQGPQGQFRRTYDELDLTDANATQGFFENEQPDYVFLSAAIVGGIHANSSFSAEFLREKLLIQIHVIMRLG